MMISVAFKMLIGNRAAFIGVIFGIFLATLLISQQSAIFLGLISRSYRIATDMPEPNIWVIDPATQGEDLIRAVPREYLEYVQSIPNIEWAVAVHYLQLPVALPSGLFLVSEIYGIDDETLMGAPPLIAGNLQDIHQDGGVIIDSHAAEKWHIGLGDRLEVNGRHATVIGIGKITPGFYPQPILMTVNSQFQKYAGSNRIEFIAAKTKRDENVREVIDEINAYPHVLALTKTEFERRIAAHFLKTGILINYALSVALGLIIGFSIAGQIFYIMTLHNLNYYALIKALGGTERMIFFMIAAQSVIVGMIGYILGTAATLLWGHLIKNTTLAFEFPWQLLAFTGGFALLICIFTASLSIRKVFNLDPQILMNQS